MPLMSQEPFLKTESDIVLVANSLPMAQPPSTIHWRSGRFCTLTASLGRSENCVRINAVHCVTTSIGCATLARLGPNFAYGYPMVAHGSHDRLHKLDLCSTIGLTP
jgi:hypothetical protein